MKRFYILELKVLARWAPAVVNHLSIATCNGNGFELAEHNKFYKKCEHPDLSREEQCCKEWFSMGFSGT